MITNINEYRNWTAVTDAPYILNNKAKEHINQYVQDYITVKNEEVRVIILDYINYILSLKLNKEDSIDIVNKVFTDPLNSPDNIDVEFIKQYKSDIVSTLEKLPSEIYFKDTIELDDDMTNNPIREFECIVYSESKQIKLLSEKINEKIVKDDFICIYKNNVLYINNIDKLNEKNRTTVLKVLKENKVLNILETLKIKRKINEKI